MTFLFAYGPLCGLSGESHGVRRHPSPRAVDEPSDHLDRTCVESILGGVFGIFEGVFVDLMIPILSPSPILSTVDNDKI